MSARPTVYPSVVLLPCPPSSPRPQAGTLPGHAHGCALRRAAVGEGWGGLGLRAASEQPTALGQPLTPEKRKCAFLSPLTPGRKKDEREGGISPCSQPRISYHGLIYLTLPRRAESPVDIKTSLQAGCVNWCKLLPG